MSPKKEIEVITHSDRVEAMLEVYRDAIGDDLDGYRNHVYRVLSYAMYFLDGDEKQRQMVETALVYHDIGLWPDKALAYLAPSAKRALADNEHFGWGLDSQVLYDCIFWHHKIFPFSGPNAKIVNAVRKADWIDASMGMVAKGMPRRHISKVRKTIPAAGFYDTLMRIGPELTNWNPFKMLSGYLRIMRL